MVDLGAPANFVNFAAANPGATVSMNFGTFGNGFSSFFGTSSSTGLSTADLTTAYTSSWASLSSPLSWSVFGDNAVTSTLYGTFSGTPANRQLTGAQNTIISRLNTEDGSFFGATSLTSPGAANLTDPYSIALRNGNPGSFTKDYNSLSQSTETLVPGSGSLGAQLYVMAPGSGVGTSIGSFSLGSDGNLTFTAAVPEPSTFGLLSLAGAGWLGMIRRRRAMVA
jgi:hypothetical protein